MANDFLKNAWYVADWCDQVANEPQCREIIGVSVLLYRDNKHTLHAMDNTCPHRFAPLHKGKLENGIIQCPYHALQFDSAGQCVGNPNGNKKIPRKARLSVYPAAEKHELIWVWMGDPDQADDATIPDFSCHSDPTMAMVKGSLTIDAYYELITDNLMALTHAVTVHEGILGSEAIARGKNTVRQQGTTVRSNSWCADGLAPPAWDAVFGHYGKPVDHWLNMRWDAPAHMLLDAGITPVGESRSEGIWVYGTDILTPVNATETRYFWAITRNHHVQDPKYDEMWNGAIEKAFAGQDKPMIEDQQRMLELQGCQDIDDTEHATIGSDAGPVKARFVLSKLIAAAGDESLPDPQNPALRYLLDIAANSQTVEPVV